MRIPHGIRNTFCRPGVTAAATALKLATASAKDLPALVELLGVLFAQEADFVPDAGKQQRALEAILGDPRIGRIYVAREGSQVVGMVSTLYTISTAEGGKAAWLEDMVVRPECRGRGIGAALLAHAVVGAGRGGAGRGRAGNVSRCKQLGQAGPVVSGGEWQGSLLAQLQLPPPPCLSCMQACLCA
jgi:GNAT superfamily N-acetyltransferase